MKPQIEQTEKIELRYSTDGIQNLSEVFTGYRVALLHGRLKSEEKESIMRAIAAGQIQLLVSRSLFEVGVDVANATVMVIEHAERFGIAQLHQLRGRVGRGGHQSLCILMTPKGITDVGRQRIKAMVSTTDGFKLAEVDLQLRGPGEMAGTRQSGLPEFRNANLLADTHLLSLAQKEAERWATLDEERERLIARLATRSGGVNPAGLVNVG